MAGESSGSTNFGAVESVVPAFEQEFRQAGWVDDSRLAQTTDGRWGVPYEGPDGTPMVLAPLTGEEVVDALTVVFGRPPDAQ